MLQNAQYSIRNLRSSLRASESYKPSYDPRKPEVTRSWPQSRQDELEDLLKKVHPDATVRKANAKDFSFRVRAGAQVVPSAPDESTPTVLGLLKPPAIMRGTDPQDLKAKEKRNEVRAELVASLANDSTASNVNSIHTKLRDLDLEDIRAGYEPTYFTRADLDHIINSPSSHAPPRSSLFASTPTTSHTPSTEGEVDWSQVKVETASSVPFARTFAATSQRAASYKIADTPIRRKLLSDILANAEEMESLEKQGLIVGPSTASSSLSPTTTLDKMNRLSIHRIFGLIMQTALVLPWAVGRKISEQRKGDFWAFERNAKSARHDEMFDKQFAELNRRLAEATAYRDKLTAEAGKGSFAFYWFRTLTLRALIFIIKLFTYYPARAAYILGRELLIFAYYCVMGPITLAEQFYRRFILPNYGKSGLRGPMAVAWGALAPITWKRYAAGENLGTLWDRNTEQAEQFIQYQRSSFNKLGYGIERTIFGLFHTSRLVGIAALLLIAIIITGIAFEKDPTLTSADFAPNTAGAQL